MKKKSLPVTNIGTISLIMIFIVLCMVTFAALSLSSAASDARLGQKMQAQLTGYYAASNKAEELLAQTDRILADTGSKTADTAEFFARGSEENAGFTTAEETDGQLTLAYQVDINDSQALSVRLAIRSPQQIKEESADSYYKILSWQVIHTKDWEGDNTLQLIQ